MLVFQNTSMPDTVPLLTISGPPASGTSSVARRLSSELQFEYINGGDIFRSMAADRDLTLSELTELSEKDDSIDKELDSRLKQIIQDHIEGKRQPDGQGLLIESRLAGCHANGKADLSVYITANPEVRYKRTEGREETLEEMKRREQSEKSRYKRYYGYDMEDPSVYDIYIDTSDSIGVEATVKSILGMYKNI